MMALTIDDWRLHGQDRYMQGVAMHWARYQRVEGDWEHDHCEFCWEKFDEEGAASALTHGFATSDEGLWVCPRCFEDFREKFGWPVTDTAGHRV